MKTGIALIVFLLLVSTAVMADQGHKVRKDWAAVAERIKTALLVSLDTYGKGDSSGAMEEVADAYFVIFEGEDANMEIAVRRFLSHKRAIALEKAFTDIRRVMHDKAPFKDVEEKLRPLTKELKKAASDLDAKGIGLDVGYR